MIIYANLLCSLDSSCQNELSFMG
uniref:Uncharacterized protein n=1 Tax=Rhizophora mucronata TaxID=61149 RepID=A0A2P2NJT3_RHIMU